MPYSDHVVGPDSIRFKRSAVAGEVPSEGSLRPGELAVNTADGIVYVGRAGGLVTPVAGGGSGPGADQSLNTTDNVTFGSVIASVISGTDFHIGRVIFADGSEQTTAGGGGAAFPGNAPSGGSRLMYEFHDGEKYVWGQADSSGYSATFNGAHGVRVLHTSGGVEVGTALRPDGIKFPDGTTQSTASGGDYLPLAGGTMTGAIVFDGTGGQNINRGTFDTGRSGSHGLSLTCTLGREFNWQAGWVTVNDPVDGFKPLYLDGGRGTSLRVWDSDGSAGTEVTTQGITFRDGTVQTTAGGGGNPFDQDLNTTDEPAFGGISLAGGQLWIGYGPGGPGGGAARIHGFQRTMSFEEGQLQGTWNCIGEFDFSQATVTGLPAAGAFPFSETINNEEYSQTILRTQSNATISLSETTSVGGVGNATLAVDYGTYSARLTLSGNGSALGSDPTTTLSVTNNGITFPDGSSQTTAYTGGGGGNGGLPDATTRYGSLLWTDGGSEWQHSYDGEESTGYATVRFHSGSGMWSSGRLMVESFHSQGNPTKKSSLFGYMLVFDTDGVEEGRFSPQELSMHGGLFRYEYWNNGGTLTINSIAALGGVVRMTGLPTTNPGVVGQLWNDNGTLKVSAGV